MLSPSNLKWRKILAASLTLSLATTFLAAPIIGRTSSSSTSLQILSAQTVTAATDTNVDSFIIEMADGVSVCREAHSDEVHLTLPRPDDRGIPVKELLPGQSPAVSGPSSPTGLTINFVALSQLQADPNMATIVAAFQRAAAVWTNRIKTPISVTINIDYGTSFPGGSPFTSNTLGATSSRKTQIDYPGLRTNLLAGSSGGSETSIYNLLPGSFVPTDIGNGAVISVNRSLAFALGIPVTTPTDDTVATMGFNSGFAFDFNPDDGITPGQTDFVSVAAHEIGHALGFTSNAGSDPTSAVSVWDMFRFRPGTTTATFPTAQRVMSIGGGDQVYFTGQTFFVNNVGTSELGLSTGGPNGSGGDGRQSSHWKADELMSGQYIGIMDPTIASGVHEEATENDFAAAETLGWNLISSIPPPPPPPVPSPPPNDNFVNAQDLPNCFGTVTGVNVGATRESGEPNHSPDNGGGARSVWYKWQIPFTGVMSVNTAGSRFDTVLAVYTGSSVNALTSLGKNDDVNSTDHTSSVTFQVTGGTTVWIAVDGYDNNGSGGDIGPIQLNWACGVAAPTILLLNQSFTKVEGDIFNIGVLRNGDSSAPDSVDYLTSDAAGTNDCTVKNGNASSRCDYITQRGTLEFAPGETSKTIHVPTVDDSYAEGPETFTITLSNAVGATLTTATATLNITDNDNNVDGPNPIDQPGLFVSQHYFDFLNREADVAGQNFWINEITSCGADTNCIAVKRINVSAAFFLSIEFQETGYLVYRVYKSAFGNLPGAPVPVRLTDFLRDTQRVGQGVQVGVGDWQTQLENNKQAFIRAFVQRDDFQNAFSNSMTAQDFVGTLNTMAGGVLSDGEKADLVAMLGNTPSDLSKRASVLRLVAEDSTLRAAEFNKAFVLMQYFGYLRRNPDDKPDSDFSGYNFWLNKLNSFGGNFVNAEMVKAFLQSSEYRQRFGP